MKKIIILALALVLVIGAAVGGTWAWMTSETDQVVNTFTVGRILLRLNETVSVYQMVPGTGMVKDPEVLIREGSESCYVYIRVEKDMHAVTVDGVSYTFDDFLEFRLMDHWKQLPQDPEVYYYCKQTDGADISVIPHSDTAAELQVLVDNMIFTKDTVTEQMLEAAAAVGGPVLSFTAYAVQQEAGADPQEAWENTFGSTDP